MVTVPSAYFALAAFAVVCAQGVTAPDLGSAGRFTILTKTGVSTTGDTSVSGGDMGVSPAAASFLTGFGLILDDSTKAFSTSPPVAGKIFASDYVGTFNNVGTPAMMTTAIGDMQTAYTAAAGANGVPSTTELGAGNIEGMTMYGGLHKWSSSVGFFSALTFDAAGDNDTVWIMQIAGDLRLATGATVTLTDGARASNIFWQVAGKAEILAGAHAEGIILCQTAIIFGAGSSLHGRALAQTAVTMIATTIAAETIDEPQYSAVPSARRE